MNQYLNTDNAQLSENIKPTDYDPTLIGLGGWMTVVIIGRFLTIIMGVIDLMDLMQCFDYLGYTNTLDFIVYFGFIYDILIVIILSGVILYFIFKRNIIFRVLFVAQTISIMVFDIAISVYMTNLGVETDSSIVRNIIFGAIWIAYLYKSKRVKNTFLYPRF